VFAPSNSETGLYRVPSSGGAPVELTKLGDGERSHRWPWFLPSGNAVLFMTWMMNESFDDAIVEAVLLDTGERKVLYRGGKFPRYISSGPSEAAGHLLFIREAALFAIPFDADRIEVLGEPTPVLDGVRTAVTNGSSQYAFSASVTLVYTRGGLLGAQLSLARVDRTGATTLLPAVPAEFFDVRLSPDESRLALHVASASGGLGGASIHVYDLA
jgi:hypothetical protein